MISVPFSGSKRYCYKAVKEIAQNGAYSAVYEPFGGSCVLSVNLMRDGVVKRAVANDYDRFFDGYEEYLNLKDFVVAECYRHGLERTTHDKNGWKRVCGDGSEKPVKSRILDLKQREWLQAFFGDNIPQKFWRYFSLGNNFTHSAVSSHKEIKLKDFCLFNGYLKTDKQREYLKALERVTLERLDWRDFIGKHRSRMDSGSLLVLDPPYVNTAQDQYSGQFTEEDTLELVMAASDTGRDFLFFNHDPEKVRKWLDGLEFELFLIRNSKLTANRNRLDAMAYVRQTERPGQISFVEREISKGANNGV